MSRRQVDQRSFGCTLYEMATGQILFTGGSNNQMLQQIQEVCGAVPIKMTKESEHGKKHFNVPRMRTKGAVFVWASGWDFESFGGLQCCCDMGLASTVDCQRSAAEVAGDFLQKSKNEMTGQVTWPLRDAERTDHFPLNRIGPEIGGPSRAHF